MTARSCSTSSWSRSAGTLSRGSARSIVALAPDAVEPVRLAGVAAAVFAALDQPRSELELRGALGPAGVTAADIADALRMLDCADLIALDQGAAS